MAPSMAALLALVVTSSIFTFAFENIKVDTIVMAGTDVKVAIDNDLKNGVRSYDSQFKYFRVYLSLSIPNYDPAPVCYLLNSSRIDVTNFKVNIPASVGPNDSQYSVVTIEFNEDPVGKEDPNNYEYSNNFYFEGGSTMYSQFELDGYVISDPNSIPCSSYDCARLCAQKYFPDNVVSDNGYKKELECFSRCPGVTLSQGDLDLSNSTSFGNTRSNSTAGTTASISNPPSNSSFTIPASTKTLAPATSAAATATNTLLSASPSASSSATASVRPGTNSASHSIPSNLAILAAICLVFMARA